MMARCTTATKAHSAMANASVAIKLLIGRLQNSVDHHLISKSRLKAGAHATMMAQCTTATRARSKAMTGASAALQVLIGRLQLSVVHQLISKSRLKADAHATMM